MKSKILSSVILMVSLFAGGSNATTNTDLAICTGTISTLFNQPIRSVKVTKINKDEIYLSYTRPQDKTLWKYKCKVEGEKVLWASDPGRWRNNTTDEQVTYELLENEILIKTKHPDGSTTDKKIPKK